MRKQLLNLLFSILTGMISFLLFNHLHSAMLLSVQLFILSLFVPAKRRFWDTQYGKRVGWIVWIVIFLFLLDLTIFISTASLIRKLAVWILVLIMHFVEKSYKNHLATKNRSDPHFF